MKADPAAQLALVDLQAYDSALAQIEHRRKTLPEHAALADIEARLTQLAGERIAAETAVGDLERSVQKLETEIDQVRTRRARDEDRLNSGAISNPKDLSNLQHEIGVIDRRIGTLEDEQLEIMEQLEEAGSVLANVNTQISQAETEQTQQIESRDRQLAVLAEEEATVRADREDVAPRIPENLMRLYDKLRAQQGGMGAAALIQRRCQGCHLELTHSDLRDLAEAAEDEVQRCPECSRILVRTIESGL